MVKLKPMTNALRSKINDYIRNKKDISDLIDGVDIKGENLARSIIKRMDRIEQDVSRCNFAGAIIGTESNTITLSACFARNCCFKGTKFVGKTIFRKTIFKGSDFTDAWVPFAEYQYADFRGCKWCGCVIRIGSSEGIKSKWDMNLFTQLIKFWDISGAEQLMGSCKVGENNG